MHKSGTTLISKILHDSGINMVDNMDTSLEYDSLYGKMERLEAVNINNAILNSNNVDSLDIEPLNSNYTVPKSIHTSISELVERCNLQYEDWGIKDPRLCLTYQIWKDLLPPHKVIVVYRKPFQVMDHYAQFYTFPKKILKSINALKIYSMYNHKILDVIKESHPPSLFINYNTLMTQENMILVIEEFVARPLNDSRKKSNYRMRDSFKLIHAIVGTLTKWRASRIYSSLESFRGVTSNISSKN